MNANEREQLTHLLNQLREAKVGERDAEADRLIRDAVAANADSSYLLVQRALLLEQALTNAKGQIAQLQREVTQRQSPNQGGFLGRNNPWTSDLGSASRDHRGRGCRWIISFSRHRKLAGPSLLTFRIRVDRGGHCRGYHHQQLLRSRGRGGMVTGGRQQRSGG